MIRVATAALRALTWLLAADQVGDEIGIGVGVGAAAKITPPPDAGVTSAAPDGDAPAPNRVCLDGLRQRQIAFVEWPTRGVRTPVRIMGPLGVVRLRSHDRRATGLATPLMDCELARALLDAGPVFRSLGIRELLFSGTYQYRTRRHSTRLSEHAHGLAIDVHTFALDPGAGDQALIDVARDFESQVGTWAVTDQDSCIGHPHTSKGRLLRTLACRLRASSVLREVITPDDNADHRDHFHLEAFPDALTRTRAVLARKPAVIDD